eukprot:TRINITY_DN1987_c0_g1_i1.p1 TRINITY_DN1987_c0_g1~~TRINITY_DN1987_c0_g1_i1.p1  ORF type:complete len:887 (+),score=181.40 TRINITY_DN1987_c0_g1_i1:68-2728(+)
MDFGGIYHAVGFAIFTVTFAYLYAGNRKTIQDARSLAHRIEITAKLNEEEIIRKRRNEVLSRPVSIKVDSIRMSREDWNIEEDEPEDDSKEYEDMGYVYDQLQMANGNSAPKEKIEISDTKKQQKSIPKSSSSSLQNYHEMYHLYYEDKDMQQNPESGYLYHLTKKNIDSMRNSREISSDDEKRVTFNDERHIHDDEYQQDWNVRFQKVMGTIRNFTQTTPLSERIQGNLNLLYLSKDFLFTAQLYGKIIISESQLPPSEKTIKPFENKGVLGGEKYVTRGILFKFACDHNNLFGSDHAAAKVAGHELKGVISYLNCGIPDLNVPLMCLVDYRGFRLIAMSILPIRDDTIIYGTCDAGRTIHSSDRKFNLRMKKAALKLNIKPHRVGPSILYSPADLEGHKGSDGNYYLLDFSRVFPPEAPVTGVKNAHLSNLLRPEFVASYPMPLCSDAFAGFIRNSHTTENQEVIQATNHLLKVLLPKFVRGELMSQMEEARQQGILEDFRLTEAIHRNGINCRYLGLVRKHTKDIEFKSIILVEIIARVFKNNLKQKLRNKMKILRKPVEEPYRRLVVNYLNLIFGNTVESDQYWNFNLKVDCQKSFLLSLKPKEADSNHIFKPRVFGEIDTNFMQTLLMRIQKLTGIGFSNRINNPAIFNLEKPFFDTDLEVMPLRIKHMNVVNFAEGFFFEYEGLTKRVSDPDAASRFYSAAISKFEEALDSNPNNKEILLNVALTWTLQLEDEFHQELAQGQYFPLQHVAVMKATEYYLRAISAPPKYDSHSLFMYAHFVERCGNHEAAEEYYLQSLEVDPNNSACLFQYGNFLSQRSLDDDAEKFFIKSSENTKGQAIYEWDYWGSPREFPEKSEIIPVPIQSPGKNHRRKVSLSRMEL